MRSTHGMRPQDILILLKLVAWRQRDWKQSDLARELAMSQAEVSHALQRNIVAGLFFAEDRRPKTEALGEFLIHGLRYVFPVMPGPLARGLLTAHSAPPIAALINDTGTPMVWPFADGMHRGQSITPLYPSVPIAALRDPILYELLALTECLRVGRAREQKLASGELLRRLREGDAR